MDGKYSNVLEKLFQDDPQIKQKKCVELFPQHLGLKDLDESENGWPTELKLKSKLSWLKALAKHP